jgi:PKD repeat protein
MFLHRKHLASNSAAAALRTSPLASVQYPIALAAIAILASSLCGKASAKEIYVAQSAQGADTGTNAGNAHSISWFNTTVNWGAGSTNISPGDTVHLCGTITNVVQAQAGGTAGNITTIFFEPNAKVSMPSLPTQGLGGYQNGGVDLRNCNYLRIDGGSNGIIECTANGSGMGQTNSVGIYGMPTIGNITIQNLTVRNLYIRTNNQDQVGPYGVYIYGNGSVSNIAVLNCSFTWCAVGVALIYSGSAQSFDFRVISNRFENINFGTCFASGNHDAHLTGAVWAWNRVNSFGAWDNPGANIYHHNGFYAWAESGVGSSITNIFVTNNIVGGNWGAPQFATAGIFLSSAGSDGIFNLLVANNVVAFTNGGASNGAMLLWNVKDSLVANNTIYDATGSYDGIRCVETCTGNTFSNNIFSGSAVCLDLQPAYAPTNAILPLASDNNIFYTAGTIAKVSSVVNPDVYLNWAGWRALGYDMHSLTKAPLFVSAATGNFSLQTNSPAIGAGANLYPTITGDASGRRRSTTGPWTIGAFEVTTYQPPVTNQVPLTPANMISLIVSQISPLTVQASGNTNAVAGVLYDFGDGGTSSAAAPIHIYATAGTYTVTRTVTNSSGAVLTAKRVSTVSQ